MGEVLDKKALWSISYGVYIRDLCIISDFLKMFIPNNFL